MPPSSYWRALRRRVFRFHFSGRWCHACKKSRMGNTKIILINASIYVKLPNYYLARSERRSNFGLPFVTQSENRLNRTGPSAVSRSWTDEMLETDKFRLESLSNGLAENSKLTVLYTPCTPPPLLCTNVQYISMYQ